MLRRAWECAVCGYVYDDAKEGVPWDELPDDWECPVCGAGKSEFSAEESAPAETPAEPASVSPAAGDYLGEWARASDERESRMADIHRMAATGESITEPMRSTAATFSWPGKPVLSTRKRYGSFLTRGASLDPFGLPK